MTERTGTTAAPDQGATDNKGADPQIALKPDSDSLSFEEFRIMYQSTELISDRKILFTRDNTSLCILMIGGQAAIGSWAIGKGGAIELIAAGLILIISVMGIVFGRYWHIWINKFAFLNEAKFAVLKEMADSIAFPDYRDRKIKSYNPFEREWMILESNRRKRVARQRGVTLDELDVIEKAKRTKGVQQRTPSEVVLPVAFVIFFALTAAVAVYWVLATFGVFPRVNVPATVRP